MAIPERSVKDSNTRHFAAGYRLEALCEQAMLNVGILCFRGTDHKSKKEVLNFLDASVPSTGSLY